MMSWLWYQVSCRYLLLAHNKLSKSITWQITMNKPRPLVPICYFILAPRVCAPNLVSFCPSFEVHIFGISSAPYGLGSNCFGRSIFTHRLKISTLILSFMMFDQIVRVTLISWKCLLLNILKTKSDINKLYTSFDQLHPMMIYRKFGNNVTYCLGGDVKNVVVVE